MYKTAKDWRKNTLFNLPTAVIVCLATPHRHVNSIPAFAMASIPARDNLAGLVLPGHSVVLVVYERAHKKAVHDHL